MGSGRRDGFRRKDTMADELEKRNTRRAFSVYGQEDTPLELPYRKPRCISPYLLSRFPSCAYTHERGEALLTDAILRKSETTEMNPSYL